MLFIGTRNQINMVQDRIDDLNMIIYDYKSRLHDGEVSVARELKKVIDRRDNLEDCLTRRFVFIHEDFKES